jgi:hypothetical protein
MNEIFDNKIWTKESFGNADLKDKRLTARLNHIVNKITLKPEANIPAQMGCWADTQACYRLLNNPKVTHKRVQATHIERTRKQASEIKSSVILFPQDGSEIEVQKSTLNAGPIGNHTCQGIMMHNCLAVEYNEKHPKVIGLANQRIWERDHVVLHKSETRRQRDNRKGKESEHWLKTLKSIGSPPEGCKWVSVGDRGNDIYEFFCGIKKFKWDAVVRASQDRVVEVNGEQEYLMQWVKSIPSKGSRVITIRRKGDTKPKDVTTYITWDKLTIFPPQRIASKSKPLELYVVRCFNEQEELDWVLYTTIPVCNLEEAIEIIKWYSCRWIIEEYHKCLKTGCKIESNQFGDVKPVEVLLGILSIVAILMLQMKYLSRADDETLACNVVPDVIVTIISTRYKLDKAKITIKEFWRAVAQLGGFLARKSDGDPGWQTLWRGWLRLLDMWIGAESLMNMFKQVI